MSGFTEDQRKIFEAAFRIVHQIAGHAFLQAKHSAVVLGAVRNLLTDKGVVTEEEWDEAIDTVEAEHQTLASLDPEVQQALAEIRRLLGSHDDEEDGR